MAQRPVKPSLVGDPLDQRLLAFKDEVREASRDDWLRRLEEVGGTGAAVPLGEVDPGKELLVLVPGKGMDFRDMQALSQLQDTYQVVILISDHDQAWDHGGRHIARALEQLVSYREALGNAEGTVPGKILRLVGHSAGALTSQSMLYDLINRGLISEREDSLFSKVRYWAIDGPWRGVDLPWIIQFLGMKYLGGLVARRPFGFDRGAQSVVNRLSPLMDIVTRDLGIPKSLLRTRHVFATGMQDTDTRLRHFEPVSSILWEELAKGEGEDLYNFFRAHHTLEAMKANRNDLDSFSPTGLTRRRGLQSLVLVMIRDLPELMEDLRDLAEGTSLQGFEAQFNSTVGLHVRSYPGQHTQFMWTAPGFIEDIRKELDAVGNDR